MCVLVNTSTGEQRHACRNQTFVPSSKQQNHTKILEREKGGKKNLAWKFKSGPQVGSPRSTRAPASISRTLLAAWLDWKCAISWGEKKLTRGYLFPLHTFFFLGCGALNTSKWSGEKKVHVLLRPRTAALSTRTKLLAEAVFSHSVAFFLSPFLYSTVHDSLLSYTAIFQLSTAQAGRGGGERAWELIWSRRKVTKLGGNSRTAFAGSPNGRVEIWSRPTEGMGFTQ